MKARAGVRELGLIVLAAAALALGCGSDPDGRGSGTGLASGGPAETGSETDDTASGGDAAFGPEQQFDLRLGDDAAPPLVLAMNRDEVAELFGDRADEVLLLELDTTALLTNAFTEIKSACGTAWRNDSENPNHDCSLTELGQSFAGPDGTWQTSAEYALVRILTMTPANADVTGTTSEKLAGLADTLNIGGGYNQILSEALGISRTTEFVTTESLVQSFKQNFVGTHPAIDPGGETLQVFLSDALTGLATMAERYGPAGEHPGVLDPTGTFGGEIFGPDFVMNAVAESNLRLLDGVDAGVGKGFVSVVVDNVGPTFDDELEFDFFDPERFSLEGVVDDLRVDLPIAVQEHDSFVSACLGQGACEGNMPGSPIGAGSVWGLEPWLLEYNIAQGAIFDHGDRTWVDSYLLGTVQIGIGQSPHSPGWTQYDVPFGIGDPPEDQYIWETINEVAQVALHNSPFQVLGEGGADVAFRLRNIPIGLTGDEAQESVRPFLQEQAALLSDYILGDYKKNNDTVDFYWRRTEAGEPYLFFVGAGDVSEPDAYAHANPGFFGSAALDPADRRSQTIVPGVQDTAHEKLAVPAGETVVFFADDEGVTYRLRVERNGSDTDLVVFVAAQLAGL